LHLGKNCRAIEPIPRIIVLLEVGFSAYAQLVFWLYKPTSSNFIYGLDRISPVRKMKNARKAIGLLQHWLFRRQSHVQAEARSQVGPCDRSRVGNSSFRPLKGFRCGPLLCGWELRFSVGGYLQWCTLLMKTAQGILPWLLPSPPMGHS